MKTIFLCTIILMLPYWSIGQEVVRKTASKANTSANSFTDSRDGEVYKTVKIGDQIWMAENLRYNAKGSYLNPNNPNEKYGRLYDWVTVMDIKKKYLKKDWDGPVENHQGICPDGWHVPSHEDWIKLEVTLGIKEDEARKEQNRKSDKGVGKALKAVEGWEKAYHKGRNTTGFSVLPAGEYSYKAFKYLGNSAYFWTTTRAPMYTDRFRLNRKFYSDAIVRGTTTKDSAISCRCVKDHQ